MFSVSSADVHKLCYSIIMSDGLRVCVCVLQAYVTDEPMVAFVCNRPAMHSTDHGWVSDDSTNCISDPVDVLNYCRKVRSLTELSISS